MKHLGILSLEDGPDSCRGLRGGTDSDSKILKHLGILSLEDGPDSRRGGTDSDSKILKHFGILSLEDGPDSENVKYCIVGMLEYCQKRYRQ